MAKKRDLTRQSVMVYELNPTECPFREFRDSELSPDSWGMSPATYRASHMQSKISAKPSTDYVWVDEQTQPLPRSVRRYLHGWIRAEDLAFDRWEAEVVIFEENGDSKMSIKDIQLSHAQVLLRSSFCRRVLSLCYILERVENFSIEHQWESFTFHLGSEGWRSRYHIYSPGLKSGGGQQHRPTLSKNGCYLVRLYYIGAWRCIWVSDQVPVDATDSPLLPFSPLSNPSPSKVDARQVATATAKVVHLWPLLLCKALLKLAAPDMNSDEDAGCCEDESMPEFDFLHALTGAMNLTYKISVEEEEIWRLMTSEVPMFAWDDDDETLASTVKSKTAKKPKEAAVKRSMTTIIIEDTKLCPPYTLPGITPAHEMDLLVIMARDVPLKKPLPEPDVPLWKTYRWVDWARRHGLYEAYDCPRTRYLKINGLLKQSYAPHLLDVQSTESITYAFREEHERTNPVPKKERKEVARSTTASSAVPQTLKEELKEWLPLKAIRNLLKELSVLYFPSMYEFTSAASNPLPRATKFSPIITALKSAPLYLQIDGPEENILRISLSMLHPRVLFNSGVPIMDSMEAAYCLLEVFEWFDDNTLPMTKAYVKTRGYNSVEIKLYPGRHFCRLWVHSRMNWHVMLVSDSALLLGSRDVVQAGAVKECPWSAKFLSNLGQSFFNWIRTTRSMFNIMSNDREFYKAYQPDLQWDPKVVGYNKAFLHWMFRQALQSFLMKRLLPNEYQSVCSVMRKYFCDPDFGLPPKPVPPKSLRKIVKMDPCDCVMPEVEEEEIVNEGIQVHEEVCLVDSATMNRLLTSPNLPIASQICESATEDLHCGMLKEEREKVVRRHEAAILIQANWRGAWARKCLTHNINASPEIIKIIMDNVFGNLESLSAFMNEFFRMYPGAKYAYSVASALSGVNGLKQHTGISPITPKCQWIPYFQGVFYCHAPVKVHFDVQSTLPYSTMAVYDNDTGKQLPQSYNAHITFDISPNERGYTVMGHGTLKQPAGAYTDAHWQLTIMSSVADVFHVCDNDIEGCQELPLFLATKLHIDEMFIPNRRNILGGIQIEITKYEAISFRAAVTSPELEMEAILKLVEPGGEMTEIGRCSGRGELYWPYIRLEPSAKKLSFIQSNIPQAARESMFIKGALKGKQRALTLGAKSRSATKIKEMRSGQLEPTQYFIEVVAPQGWPLTLAQWIRVNEIRDSLEFNKVETPSKKPAKEKVGSAKDKEKDKTKEFAVSTHQPQPGDAFVELECSLAVGAGSVAKRDERRDLEFAAATKAWEARDSGRNARGAQIRKEFRAEFLEAQPPPPSESVHTLQEEMVGEDMEGEGKKTRAPQMQQGPTPASESEVMVMSTESEEEALYLTMPEQLKDKFIPLHFVPFCTKTLDEEVESVVMTPQMLESAKMDRQNRLETAYDRMRELQTYNEIYVLGRQKRRCQLLETLFVDAQWNPKLASVLEERDDAIALEALNRTLSATKKKMEAKKK